MNVVVSVMWDYPKIFWQLECIGKYQHKTQFRHVHTYSCLSGTSDSKSAHEHILYKPNPGLQKEACLCSILIYCSISQNLRELRKQ